MKYQTTLIKLAQLLNDHDRRRAITVALFVAVHSLFEVMGAASIMPLLTVLADPENIATNSVTAPIYKLFNHFGVYEYNQFVIGLLFSLLTITIVTFFVRSFSTYRLSLFIEETRYSIGNRLLSSYLSQDFKFFLSKNSNELSKNLLSEVDQVIGKVLDPVVKMASQLVVGAAVLTFVLIINPVIALSAVLVISLIYFIIFISIKNYLATLGEQRIKSNKLRFILAGEIFGGIKTIRVAGKEKHSLGLFQSPSRIFCLTNSKQQVVSQIPAFLVESIAISLLITFTYFNFISDSTTEIEELVPILGLYAFVFYKIRPVLNSLFVGAAGLRYGAKAVDQIQNDLQLNKGLSDEVEPAALKLRHELKVEDLSFQYEGSRHAAFTGIDFSLKAGQRLGIVGKTGSGKSTLISQLLGLLKPSQGKILADGVQISEKNIRAWQKNVGYVPQEIFLIDASVAENIAFCIPKEKIDYQAVEKAARIAKIHDFVETSLPFSYDTVVGDRGMRLSGGERQRLGIARALYSNPDILILDEATSALDTVTEEQIMDELEQLSSNKTLILVAHRLTTLKKCDQILVLKDGRVDARGDFSTLEKTSESFLEMLTRAPK